MELKKVCKCTFFAFKAYELARVSEGELPANVRPIDSATKNELISSCLAGFALVVVAVGAIAMPFPKTIRFKGW